MHDLKGSCHDVGFSGQTESDLEGETEDPLSDGLHRQDGIDKVGGGLTHPSGPTTGAKTATFATERHQVLQVAGFTLHSEKAISMNWRGKPLVDFETVINLIGSTKTKKGLKVKANLDTKIYEKGIKISDKDMKKINLKYGSTNPKWNYEIAKNG